MKNSPDWSGKIENRHSSLPAEKGNGTPNKNYRYPLISLANNEKEPANALWALKRPFHAHLNITRQAANYAT